jgi:hypothetical protein
MKTRRGGQPVLVLLLVALALAAASWVLYGVWQERRGEAARQRQEATEAKARAEALARRVVELEAALPKEPAAVPGAAAEALFGGQPPGAAAEDPAAVQRLEGQVKAFFAYLDGRDYVQRHGLEGGTHALYADAVEALAANRPQVAGETESLAATLGNSFHLFRVMGRRRIELAAEILSREGELLEPAMEVFHRWHAAPPGTLRGRAPLPVLADYAAFLLHTLGGRSYLLRRDGRTRTLTTYYCLLVLDQANDAGLNRAGVDIRPFLRTTAEEFRNLSRLLYRQRYLDELQRLAAKYPG